MSNTLIGITDTLDKLLFKRENRLRNKTMINELII